MELTENALYILDKRYLATKDDGTKETPEDLFRRVAKYVASAEKADKKEWEEKFYNMMVNLEALPNTPCLINAGRKVPMLSACFSLPIEDSLDSILDTLKYTGKIFKTGGGVGINFSPLRPKNSKIKTSEGSSSGVVSFMEMFDIATEKIKQGGVRRGAMIGLLNVNHPEIREFITSKTEEGILSNFNISVAVTDKFMDAVEKDKEIELTHPEARESIKIKARDIWKLIIEGAWKNGEPGIVFIDRINEFNTLTEIGPIQCVNPCGELPLLPFESCNLGSINLLKMVKPDDGFDWDKLEHTVKLMVRFLDNVIDVNKLPLPEIDKMTKANRKIGLGIMGWADALIHMKIRYDSKEAFKLADKLINFIKNTAFETSKELADERGAFPNFNKSIYWDLSRKGSKYKMRNATLLSIAPTGTLSAIAGVSSGIEPNFAWQYEAHRLNTVLKEMHPMARKYIEKKEQLPEYFIVASDIKPEHHVKMQSVFQRGVDNSISKTINCPNSTTVDDIDKIYKLAWESGCKGITVYREGSRQYEMLSKQKQTEKQIKIRTIPKEADGKNFYINTGCGKLYVNVTLDDNGQPLEVFTNTSHGGCQANSEGLGRMISLWLRAGFSVDYIIDKIRNIKCPSAMQRSKECKSCPDGIAIILSKFTNDNGNGTVENICPSCKAKMIVGEGCITCPSCGFTKCSN